MFLKIKLHPQNTKTVFVWLRIIFKSICNDCEYSSPFGVKYGETCVVCCKNPCACLDHKNSVYKIIFDIPLFSNNLHCLRREENPSCY